MNRKTLALVTAFPQKKNVRVGGIEGVAECLAEEIAARGEFIVHIVAPSSGRNEGIEIRGPITIHWASSPQWLPGFISYWSSTRILMHRILHQIKPDITHFHGPAGLVLGYERPYVLTIHGIAERDVEHSKKPLVNIRKSIIKSVENYARRNTNNFIIINPYVDSELGNSIIGHKWYIENPVDYTFFNKERSTITNTILFIGRITPLKNLHRLLMAFNILKKREINARLIIAGPIEENDYFNQCNNYVSGNDLTENIDYVGVLSKDELAKYLASSACLALPSLQENAPLVIAEAMAVGVPIVASPVGGIKHMLTDFETGFLVSPHSEHEIADRIHKMLVDKELNISIGNNCRNTAQARFHPRVIAERTLTVYRNILSHF